MSVLFHLRRGRALLGATAVLITLVLASTASAVPARDQTTMGPASAEIAAKVAAAKAQGAYYASYADTTPIQRTANAAPADETGPSWLAFALAAGRPGRSVITRPASQRREGSPPRRPGPG
jgi:hypothetical protein